MDPNLPGLGGVTAYPYHLTARLLVAMLQRDYLAFPDTVDTDQPRPDRCGVDGMRMLYKRLSIHVQTPNLNAEADGNTWFDVLDHKNPGEIRLMVLSNGCRIQWKHTLR